MRDLDAELRRRHESHLYRTRRVVDGPQGPEMVVDGQPCLTFCSNDYLGLANHADVRAALARGLERYGAGSGAAHLVNGHSAAHHALEEELAEFTGRPRALLFSTGYMANLGVVSALIGAGDSVFEDRLNHASLLDAGVLSRARFARYRHADTAHLARQLALRGGAQKLVLTDGVFSMDGDLAPLPELARVAQQAGAWLMVDDAHGLGVLGEGGGGSLEAMGLGLQQVPVLMGTLGKAFGTFGAFVAGSEALIETLIQSARSYIYTTASPAAVAEATRASLRLIRQQPWRRLRLQELIRRFRRGAEQVGLRLAASTTPIQPLMIGDNAAAVAMSVELLRQGILVSAIRPPTVPSGTARLRVTLSATHSDEQVDRLLSALEKARRVVPSS